jgi:signal transduction histidine kinase
VLNFLKPRIDFKKLEIDKQFNNDEKIIAFADFNMVEAALRNVVSNAVKFSYNGGVIKIKAYTRKDRTVIEIEDSGMGMDQKALKTLFTYDRSSQKTGTTGEESFGIGLYLSHDFLKKNEATIDVESEKGQGTRFIITFIQQNS